MEKFKNAKIEDLDAKLQKQIKEILKNEEKGILFMGETGVGKTHALYAIANTRVVKPPAGMFSDKNSRYRGRVRNFIEMLINFRDKMKDGHYRNEILNLMSEESIFIDDLGAEKISEFVQEFVYTIINGSYNKNHRLFITTNLSLDELEKQYGSRIVSRLAEMCEFIVVNGKDRRL